jgi:hypothetical protein
MVMWRTEKTRGHGPSASFILGYCVDEDAKISSAQCLKSSPFQPRRDMSDTRRAVFDTPRRGGTGSL